MIIQHSFIHRTVSKTNGNMTRELLVPQDVGALVGLVFGICILTLTLIFTATGYRETKNIYQLILAIVCMLQGL